MRVFLLLIVCFAVTTCRAETVDAIGECDYYVDSHGAGPLQKSEGRSLSECQALAESLKPFGSWIGGWVVVDGDYHRQFCGDANCSYDGGGGVVVARISLSCPAGYTRQLDGSCLSKCPEGEVPNAEGVCEKPVMCQMFPGPVGTPEDKPADCSCPSGSKWVPLNGCRATCPGVKAGDVANAGFDIFVPEGEFESCLGGCGVQQKAGEYLIVQGGRYAPGAYTGWACKTIAAGAPDPTVKDSPQLDKSKVKPPVCGPTDGVMTSSSGKVLCVPEGTPNAAKPAVTQEKKIETFDDGSTKDTVQTTTRDPVTNATDSSVSVTVTPASNGQPGKAGTPGSSGADVSKSDSGTSGNPNGDKGGGGCDPTLNFCGGRNVDKDAIYQKKDKTFESVLTEFKTNLANTNLVKGATSFFDVSIPAGSCSGLSARIPFLNITVDLTPIFCSPQVEAIMGVVSMVLQFVVAFLAFKWAFL